MRIEEWPWYPIPIALPSSPFPFALGRSEEQRELWWDPKSSLLHSYAHDANGAPCTATARWPRETVGKNSTPDVIRKTESRRVSFSTRLTCLFTFMSSKAIPFD